MGEPGLHRLFPERDSDLVPWSDRRVYRENLYGDKRAAQIYYQRENMEQEPGGGRRDAMLRRQIGRFLIVGGSATVVIMVYNFISRKLILEN